MKKVKKKLKYCYWPIHNINILPLDEDAIW